MARTLNKIALLQHIGGGNLGDDATVDVFISNIRKRCPGIEIAAFSMNPEDAAKKHGVPSYPIRRHTWSIGYKSSKDGASQSNSKLLRFLRTSNNPAIKLPRAILRELGFLLDSLRLLKTFDLLIIGGGGQLTDRSGPWGFPYAIFSWVMLAKIARVTCVFVNVGAGPLDNRISKFMVVRSLYSAKYVSFRDEESRALVRNIGYKRESQVFPDSVYSLEVALTNVLASRNEQPVVGIAPMPYPFCDPQEDPSQNQAIYEDMIAKLSDFGSSLVGQSYSLELFGSDTGVDPAVIEDLRTALKNRHNISLPPYVQAESIPELFVRIAKMDFVVTCRFHGVVFAHLLNKPVLALSHHPKVTNLMKAIGLPEYCVDMQSLDPVKLKSTFAALVSNADIVKRTMAASLLSNKSKLTSQFDELFPATAKETVKPEAKATAYTGSQDQIVSERSNL
jgi:polysaccharide pyruvyl transferase WcaK-like protein